MGMLYTLHMRWHYRLLRDVRDSIITSTVLAFFAWILSVPVLGNSYYLSVFLPLLSVGCLSIARFAYLRHDNRVPKTQQRQTERAPTVTQPGTELFAEWDGPLIPRNTSGDTDAETPPRRTLTRVLILTASTLALASAALYYLLGIGARYFVPG